MHPAFLYLPGERLTLSELCAARLDGHVIEIGEAFIPADLVEAPGTRAAAIASLIPLDTAACGPTAAWIHGAGDRPPTVHHIRRAVPRRIRPRVVGRIVFHDTAVHTDDLERRGGVLVMTAVRTMVDLALGLHRDPSLLRWVHLLADVDRGLLDGAIDTLDTMVRVPGSRAGRAALERAVVRRR